MLFQDCQQYLIQIFNVLLKNLLKQLFLKTFLKVCSFLVMKDLGIVGLCSMYITSNSHMQTV